MPNEPDHKVAIVIPTWKRGDLLRLGLESLRRQSFTDFETIIVANGAGEWAEELARAFGCKLVRFTENRGFAAAVNAGIAASRSSYVVVLNDDVELAPDWLARLTALLDECAELSFCCGKILRPDGKTIDNAGDALSLGGGAWRLGYGRADSTEFDQPRPLFAISGTASLFRRAVFEKVGGFDEDFVSYLEDMDLSIRLWRAGFRGWYLPQAVARHHGGASLDGEDSAERFRLMTRNQQLLGLKHYPVWVASMLFPRLWCAGILWTGMAFKKGRLGACLRGTMGVLPAYPRMLWKRLRHYPCHGRAFLAWLRESDRAIYEDISSRPRDEQDTYWRMYFSVFRPKAVAGPVSARDLTPNEKAGPSLRSG